MKCCLVSSDVSWHIRDKLWPMPKHGSLNLYVHGNQKLVRTDSPGRPPRLSHSPELWQVSVNFFTICFYPLLLSAPPPPPSPETHRPLPCVLKDDNHCSILQNSGVVRTRGGRPGLPVPNKPYGFCGRKATLDRTEQHIITWHQHPPTAAVARQQQCQWDQP